jgi:hypothetical protein
LVSAAIDFEYLTAAPNLAQCFDVNAKFDIFFRLERAPQGSLADAVANREQW